MESAAGEAQAVGAVSVALSSSQVPRVILSSNMKDLDASPYFMWDEPMSVRQLKDKLAHASVPEKIRLKSKILREARDTDVWEFLTPQRVAAEWSLLSPRLGRRRAFWEFLLNQWRQAALID